MIKLFEGRLNFLGDLPTMVTHSNCQKVLYLKYTVFFLQGVPPAIGFKEIHFENQPQDGANQDTSRDLTLSRVFAADEFLGVSQMKENYNCEILLGFV